MTDTRPRPEYGEYASPAEQAEAMGISEAELAAVTAPKPAPGKPADEAEGKIEPSAGLLPPPRPEDAIPLPPPPAPAAAKNRRWDRAATYAMLFFGIYWLVVFTASFRDLGTAMEQTTTMLDLGEFTSFALADSFGFWLSIIVPVVYVITAGIAIVRVRAGKLAFFVPLIGAGVGGVIILVFFTILMYSDPALSAAFQSGQ